MCPPLLCSGLFLRTLVPLWQWHLKSQAVFPSLHTTPGPSTVFYAQRSTHMPSGPRHSSSGSTACFYTQGTIPAGWPDSEQQGGWRALRGQEGEEETEAYHPEGKGKLWGTFSLTESGRPWIGAALRPKPPTRPCGWAMGIRTWLCPSQPSSQGRVTPWWAKHSGMNSVQRIEKVLELASTALSGPVWF